MLTLQNLFMSSTSPPSSCSSPTHFLFPYGALAAKTSVAGMSRCPPLSSSCSLRLQELSMEEPLESREVFRLTQKNNKNDLVPSDKHEEQGEEEEEEEEKGISKIQVSRERYIRVSKAELLDAIVSKLFSSQDDAKQFLLLSSCVDSILHAEHKSVLEQMRADYSLIHSMDDEENSSLDLDGKGTDNGENSDKVGNGINGIGSMDTKQFDYSLDLRNFLGSSGGNDKRYSNVDARDLMLTSALNTDYLLTLPIYVDWKKASESNSIIFRRGYATERQKGLLIVEKLDYVQSRLLQGIFFLISKPMGKVGLWIKEVIGNVSQTQEIQDWVKEMTPWLEKLSIFQQAYFNNEQTSNNPMEIDQISDGDLPIRLASQRAVSRYEGFLSPVGPRERLFRKLLTWIGLVPPVPEAPFELACYNNASQPHLRPIFLSRISLSDIWRPATRKYCGNNLWKKLKTSFSILFSQSVLQEPAFEQLILLYTKEMSKSDAEDKAEVPSLQLKIYERIPIPELPVVFPDKKLSFRIIDSVRLDVATILGLSAYFINYKFENILSSPSAIFLDVIAITALIIYITRVALGYKQTWDRYQLLVNKTLYEKTVASGFGSVHFLLDASEQQQYKEAVLTYAILLKAKNGQVTCRRSVGDECEKFMYHVFEAKVEMPVDKALDTLVRLGLVTETPIDGRIRLQAIDCGMAYETLKERWNSLLG